MLGDIVRIPYTAWESATLISNERREEHMQCVKCGNSIAPGLDQCPRCGSFVDAGAGGEPFLAGASGIPVALFTPSTQGPPRSPEPYPTATLTYAPQKIRGYRAIEAPAHASYSQRPRRRMGRVLLLPTLLVVVLVGGVIFASSAGALSGLGLLMAPNPQPVAHVPIPTTTATTAPVPSACQNAVPDPAAAHALSQVQLTSTLRNAAKKDYRPTDKLSEVHAGQQVYLTFRVAAPSRGDVGMLVCWQQGQAMSEITFAAHSNGRYGQIPLQIPFNTNGQAIAILTWNGQNAAVVYFLVEL